MKAPTQRDFMAHFMIPARILFVAQAFRTMQRVRMPPEYTAR
jgi:hypothetical protein